MYMSEFKPKDRQALRPSISSVSKSDFLSVMRNVACTVSVVTTDGVAGRHGGTVSSFCSVSADPAIMLVCLNRASRLAQQVEANGSFVINVLACGSNELANRFAGFDDHQLSVNDSVDRFMGIDLQESGYGPEIKGASTLSCVVQDIVPSGSHLIVTGLVTSLNVEPGRPLTYLDGAYHSVKPQQS